MRTVTFNYPFRESGSLVDPTIASTLFEVALAGRGFFLDTSDEKFRMESIEAMRAQTDDGEQAGEGSLSNVDLWRRSVQSWHLGAGQTRGDDDESSPYRFQSSKGVNVWDRWKLSMLNAVSLEVAGLATPTSLVTVGSRLVHQAGSTFQVTDDGVTWSSLTTVGTAPTTPAVSDGTDMYYTTAAGVRKLTQFGIDSAAFTLADVDVIGFSKGRLWAGAGNTLSWMTTGSPTTAVTVSFGTFVWTAICDGSRATYAAGYSGDQSQIWRIPIKTDGTGLDAATVAWSAPDGEIVHSMTSYLGYILIGTNKGVRFAVADDDGDLTPGSFIPTPEPVYCFEPQDRFVWFGWSDYDATSTGLGRVDLSVFTSALTPAYASDLMAPTQGVVKAIATFAGKRFFAIEGVGVYTEQDTLVAEGTIVTSEWTFGIDDDKIATLVGIKHEPLVGSVAISLVIDGFASGTLAESAKQGSSGPASILSVDPIRAHRFSLGLRLLSTDDGGPVVTGTKLMARPVPPHGARIVLPIMLSEQHDRENAHFPGFPVSDLSFLRGLWRTGAAVTLQWGGESYNVFPTNFEFVPYRQTLDRKGWTGTCVMELREVAQ